MEKEVLMPRLAKLREQIHPGFSSLIWSSLTIDSFTQQAEKVSATPDKHCEAHFRSSKLVCDHFES